MPRRKNPRRQEVRSHAVLRPLLSAFEKDYPGFRKESINTRLKLMQLVWQAGLRYRRHHSEEGAFWFDYRELEETFGRNGFKIINARLRMFVVWSDWSKVERRTKPYRFSPLTESIRREALRKKPRGQLSTQIDGRGRTIRTPPRAVAANDTTGKSNAVWAREPVPNRVPVNLGMLDALAGYLDGLLYGQLDLFIPDKPKALKYRRELLAQVRMLATTEVAGRSNILHRYTEARTGRLSAQDVNLQSAPRCIRKAALQGLWDYDFANCHFAILLQMAAPYGCSCPHIEAYLSDKKGIRQRIAQDISLHVEAVKRILLSLIYGAHATEWHEADIPKLIGRAMARALYKHPLFVGIHQDVKTARQAILSNCLITGRSLHNQVGKPINKSASPAERLAHLVQGVEVSMLRTALRLCPDKIVLLVHDGFVSTERLDVTQIEGAIQDETGYCMKLEETQITMAADFDLEAELEATATLSSRRHYFQSEIG